MIEIQHTAHSQSPRSAVWQRLADLEGWHEWGPWTKTTVDGDRRTLVSERKRMTGRPYVMKERVTNLEPEERLEYDLLSGLPVREYHAVVQLADADGGTDITWSATFKSPWPFLGGLWRGAMLKVLRDVSEALANAPAIKA
jgi:Polyketide cyclase / dehydrase and lipid transport